MSANPAVNAVRWFYIFVLNRGALIDIDIYGELYLVVDGIRYTGAGTIRYFDDKINKEYIYERLKTKRFYSVVG